MGLQHHPVGAFDGGEQLVERRALRGAWSIEIAQRGDPLATVGERGQRGVDPASERGGRPSAGWRALMFRLCSV